MQTGETDSEAKRGRVHFLERAAGLLERMGPFDLLGISTAGQVDLARRTIRYANDNIPGYTGADVKGFFEGRFSVPTAVLNDICAAALGKGEKGAADGTFAGVMPGGLITHPEAMVAGRRGLIFFLWRDMIEKRKGAQTNGFYRLQPNYDGLRSASAGR